MISGEQAIWEARMEQIKLTSPDYWFGVGFRLGIRMRAAMVEMGEAALRTGTVFAALARLREQNPGGGPDAPSHTPR